MNGFDISNITIPSNEVHQGGPLKDGIPAIDNPKFVNANQAKFLTGIDEVLAISSNGIAKAYPIRILNYHEVVNDTFKEQSVIVTFCPLCGSGVAFSGNIDGVHKAYPFSVLRKVDSELEDTVNNTKIIITYNIGSDSATIKDESGNLLPATTLFWFAWNAFHPDTLIYK